jgi:predicted DNA-binding transcriptional regulator YafY
LAIDNGLYGANSRSGRVNLSDSKSVQGIEGRWVTMAGKSPLIRQWTLIKILASRPDGLSVQEMASEMGVSIKTIRRDLETFSQTGFSLYYESGPKRKKRWRLSPETEGLKLFFNFEEAAALYLGRQLLEPLAGTPFWNASQRAFRKIRSHFGESVTEYMERFPQTFHLRPFGSSDYSGKYEIIDTLMVAIEDRRVCRIVYKSNESTEFKNYPIHPYGLTYQRNSLYLIGFHCEEGEVRHWKVDRIESVETESDQFEPPEDFNLEEHLRHSFGIFQGDKRVKVQIRFDKSVARHIEESSWHPTQVLSGQDDGSLIAEFDLSDTHEIQGWILSFGRHAEVIGPDELRERIIGEVTKMQFGYKT